jgi:hypothetical protein
MATAADGAQAVWVFAEHEHRDLIRGINRIHDVACEVGGRATPAMSHDFLDILTWLDHVLEPHIAWEEGWLYPEIDARTGTPWATRAARFDHQQVREKIRKLRGDHETLGHREPEQRHGEMRYHLFGLEAILRAHIEREERFLIPLLADASPS